ncbi:ABC transporter substrate-binding protein [Alteromonas sp. 1_MG-2023]|uniref:ABC transporter substrate-binding protein n=1 Tax=Alteromonas sp. 1_MG-2023 TaxID=3062669 RepID=UPI0026E38139|nr:ABC transporter substrate-binding protein [Alteromonas sp. 1_MG-2023]MDO6565601.1 ABC transporter substrate-binding protein [Alteromonas sp. 1_MG-2023]
MRLRFTFWLLTSITLSFHTNGNEASSPLYIGIDADFSAVAVDGGIAIKQGVELAVDEINKNGGLLGRELAIVSKDHRGNPARGIHNIKQFAANKDVIAVIAGVHTPVALAELEIIHELNLLFLVPWAAGTQVVDNQYKPNNVFRVSVRDAEAGKVLIQHAASRGFKSVALVLERTGWGRSNELSLTQAASEMGITITTIRWVNWQQKVFEEDISAIKSDKAEAIILVSNAPEGAVVINELAAQNLTKLPVISHWGIASGNFIERLNVEPHSLDLSVLQTFHFDHQKHVQAQQLLETYHEKYGLIDPNAIPAVTGIAHAYDLVNMLAVAIVKAGTTDVDALRNTLEDLGTFEGVLKTYQPAFTPTQHDALMAKDYFMSSFDNKGNLVVLDTD